MQGFYATANSVWKKTIENNFYSLSNSKIEETPIQNQDEDQNGGKLDYLRNKWKSLRSKQSGSS